MASFDEHLTRGAPFISGLLVLIASILSQNAVVAAISKHITEKVGTAEVSNHIRDPELLEPFLNLQFDRVQVASTLAATLPGFAILAVKDEALVTILMIAVLLVPLAAWLWLSKSEPGWYAGHTYKRANITPWGWATIAICGCGIFFAWRS